jgi:hypothetical protein
MKVFPPRRNAFTHITPHSCSRYPSYGISHRNKQKVSLNLKLSNYHCKCVTNVGLVPKSKSSLSSPLLQTLLARVITSSLLSCLTCVETGTQWAEWIFGDWWDFLSSQELSHCLLHNKLKGCFFLPEWRLWRYSQKFISITYLSHCLFFLLLCCGYIVTFAKVLTIYLSWIHPLIPEIILTGLIFPFS